MLEKCSKSGAKVVLYGYPAHNATVKRVIPAYMIAAEFVRPADISSVVKSLAKMMAETVAESVKKNLLIIDDQPVFLRTAMGWFKDLYSVAVAPSFATAMKTVAKAKPDLILLDYEMPRVTGDQAYNMLCEDDELKNVLIVFLTSKSEREVVEKLLKLKPAGYILKTEPQEKIVDYIRGFLGQTC